MTALEKTTVIVILLVMATIDAEAVRKIPEFLHICHADDPEFETCVINSVHNLKPYLKVGMPEYKIPCLEPLKLQNILISPMIGLRMLATDVKFYGASNFEVTELKMDFNKLKCKVKVKVPDIFMEGNYSINTLIPLHISGPMRGNYSNWMGTCWIRNEKYFDRYGVEKIRPIEFKVKFKGGTGTVRLENQFSSQVLVDLVNSYINDNFFIFIKTILPVVEMGLSNAFRDLAENIAEQFSFAQLFPGA